MHIPYCVHKCHYCDFNSHAEQSMPWQAYGEALHAELRHWARQPAFAGRRLATLFIGGGTPSLAPPSLIGAIIDHADALFGLDSEAEITLEANPGTADAAHFSGYRQAGVNRLSMGVQSLNDAELRWLERIHTAGDALAAFDLARRAGFSNLNLDLMYALPGQSVDGWLQSLQAAIRLAPEHLSCYQLTVEPHTRLAVTHKQQPLPLPDEESALAFFHLTRLQLQAAGYAAYEVSNFARTGYHCRHNDGYWLYRDYIGIGAGAAGKWDEDDGGISRYSNIRTPSRYIAAALERGAAIQGTERLDRDHAAAEAVWLGLRRSAGISDEWFTSRFGTGLRQRFGRQLSPWLDAARLQWSGDALHLTGAGLEVADAVAASVL